MSQLGQFAGKRVVVMGLGRFGGGIGVTRWLAAQGADVLVTDTAEPAVLQTSVNALEGLPIQFRLGGHDEADLDGADLLVISPAVNKRTSSFVQAACRRGIPLTSEMNLFLERCRSRVVGVTGSVGKSTTTAMIGAVLQAGLASSPQRAWVGGNIGRSLLDDLPAIGSDDVIVLELSSFQLEDLGGERRCIDVAVLTNLQPNHLDRHETMSAYTDAKMNLIRATQPGGTIIVNVDDADLTAAVERVRRDGMTLRRISLHDESADVHVEGDAIVLHPAKTAVLALSSLAVPGRHNVYNAMMAVAVGDAFRVPAGAAAQALSRFAGLPHRLELVATVDGVRYFNDSKSTTPGATITAIDAFDAPIVAIVGGYDKGSTFDEMGRRLAERARAVICLGATARSIADAVRNAAQHDSRLHVQCVETFDAAVDAARHAAQSGDVVLLSPSCASWDMFTNYEQRGDRFKAIVQSWSTQ